jgi:hypothetical protein
MLLSLVADGFSRLLRLHYLRANAQGTFRQSFWLESRPVLVAIPPRTIGATPPSGPPLAKADKKGVADSAMAKGRL